MVWCSGWCVWCTDRYSLYVHSRTTGSFGFCRVFQAINHACSRWPHQVPVRAIENWFWILERTDRYTNKRSLVGERNVRHRFKERMKSYYHGLIISDTRMFPFVLFYRWHCSYFYLLFWERGHLTQTWHMMIDTITRLRCWSFSKDPWIYPDRGGQWHGLQIRFHVTWHGQGCYVHRR